MSGIQSFSRRHLTTLLLLLLAGGFAVILGELVLYQHFEGAQRIGFASTVVGLIIVLWGLFAKGRIRLVLASLLVLLSVAGILGVFQHSEGAEEEVARPALVTSAGTVQNIANVEARVAQDDDSGNEQAPAGETGEAGETSPPPLAPLGLSGLALMGAVVLFAKHDEPEIAPGV